MSRLLVEDSGGLQGLAVENLLSVVWSSLVSAAVSSVLVQAVAGYGHEQTAQMMYIDIGYIYLVDFHVFSSQSDLLSATMTSQVIKH